MTRRFIAGLVFGAGAVLLSCQVILGLDEPFGTPRPIFEAGPGVPDLCEHRYEPGPPDATTDDTVGGGRWFAAQSYELPYVGDAGLGVGLDLDGRCTCNPDPEKRDAYDGGPSCTPRTALGPSSCDKSGGVDDAFGTSLGSFFTKVSSLDPRGDGNTDILHGLRTAMFYLADWNGAPNDANVTVALVASSGLVTPQGCADSGAGRETPDGSVVDGQLYYPPLFDGCDRWSIQPGDAKPNLGLPPTPTVMAIRAYVRDGVLVADLGRSAIALLGTNAYSSEGHLVARMTPVPGVGYTLDGFLAGRISFTDLVNAASSIPILSDGKYAPLCKQPAFRNSFITPLCGDLDLMEHSSQDNTGQVCDAVSVVFGFHAVSSLVANQLRPLDAGALPCSDESFTCF